MTKKKEIEENISKQKTFDSVSVQIFSNLFASIAEEMGAVLERTAFSANIKERRDFSCALFDSNLNLIAEGSHIPVHLGAMPLSLRYIVNHLQLEDGDVAIANDPYAGGTHLPDITLVSPVFLEEKVIGYVVSRAHHSDVGGIYPGSMGLTRSIEEEGVCIPPTLFVKRGKLNNCFLDSFISKVRNPKERHADLRAQLAANSLGVNRFVEIYKKYGSETISMQIKNLVNYTSNHTKALIKGMPDGVYCFTDYLDDDGFTNKKLPIKASVRITDDKILIDFEGTHGQVDSCINATLAVTTSAVYYVIKCLIPAYVPVNEGIFKHIKILAPIGTLVNATYPAAVAAGNVETSQRIVDVLLGAFAQAMQDKIPAASQGTMNNISFGFCTESGHQITHYETIAGGMGAALGFDGLSAVQTHMTNTLNTPIEALELNYPVRIKEYKIRHNSGGDGLYKGGNGIIRSFEFLKSATVSILSERRLISPYGIAGGKPGKKGENILVKNNVEISGKLNQKQVKSIKLAGKTSFNVESGDIITIKTPGGGGYGKRYFNGRRYRKSRRFAGKSN